MSITCVEELPQTRVVADDMLPSLFRNLLRNAINHNDTEAPEVTISAAETEDEVRVAIADNGPGSSVEDRDRIFQKGETRRESTGTGIWLYLVQTLVEQYEGEIKIEDNEPEGAVFVVTLPTAPAD